MDFLKIFILRNISNYFRVRLWLCQAITFIPIQYHEMKYAQCCTWIILIVDGFGWTCFPSATRMSRISVLTCSISTVITSHTDDSSLFPNKSIRKVYLLICISTHFADSRDQTIKIMRSDVVQKGRRSLLMHIICSII